MLSCQLKGFLVWKVRLYLSFPIRTIDECTTSVCSMCIPFEIFNEWETHISYFIPTTILPNIIHLLHDSEGNIEIYSSKKNRIPQGHLRFHEFHPANILYKYIQSSVRPITPSKSCNNFPFNQLFFWLQITQSNYCYTCLES